jgi:LysM repeat protein
MQTPNANPPKTETGSAPPERGRVWRIVIIVLALHAALLGSVVLIQGCGSKETPAVSVKDALDDSSRAADSQASAQAAKDDTNSVSSSNIICPSTNILTPEEKLPTSNETTPAETPATLPGPDTTIAQADAPKAVTEQPKTEAPKAEAAPAEAPVTVKYTVCKGDTLSKIAKRKSVTLRELTDLNKISSDARLKIGQKLLLPVGKSTAVAAKEAPAPAKATVAAKETPAPAKAAVAKATRKTPSKTVAAKSAQPLLAGKQTHIVKAGESVYSIAQRYKVNPQTLMKVNQISDPRKIRVSQKLIVPSASARSASAKIAAKPDTGVRMVSNKTPPAEEPDVAAPIEPAIGPEPQKAAAKTAAESKDLGEEVEGT